MPDQMSKVESGNASPLVLLEMNREQCSFLICLGVSFSTAAPRTIAHAVHREAVRRKPTHEKVQVLCLHHGLSVKICPNQTDLPMLRPLLAIQRSGIFPTFEVLLAVHLLQRRWAHTRARPSRADVPLGTHPFIREVARTECEWLFPLQLSAPHNVMPHHSPNMEGCEGCSR